jgi:hypothetical protein
LQLDKIPNKQSLQAFAHHSTHGAPEAFKNLPFFAYTRLAHQLIAGASVEQNSIGHTQIIIIISQDFKRIPEGLNLRGNFRQRAFARNVEVLLVFFRKLNPSRSTTFWCYSHYRGRF